MHEQDRDELCVCGHGPSAHAGHTHQPDTPEPTHCGCCFCAEYRPIGKAQTYRLKSLAWELVLDGWWRARSLFGDLHVEGEDGDAVHWRYCFDEVYDEGRYEAGSVAEAKAAADLFYRGRVLPALEAVPAATPPRDNAAALKDAAGKWPGDETDERLREALEELK